MPTIAPIRMYDRVTVHQRLEKRALSIDRDACRADYAACRIPMPMTDPRVGWKAARFRSMSYGLLLLSTLMGTTKAVDAEDLSSVLTSVPVRSWQTSNAPNLKFCVITSIASKTGQASTVVDSGADTVVIVHNWTSPVPGNDVRAIITIKPNGELVFRGQKTELIREIDRCTNL